MSTAFIIDDHKDSADMLESYLQAEGFQTATFYDFASGYAAIVNHQPCIAIIDLNVPGTMDAATFIAQTKGHFPDLPVVIMSGDPRAKSAADRVQALFLLKPFSLDEVVSRVRESCPKN